MMSHFIITTLLAGLGIAIIAGPLGTFIVWRRMAYFGDALAHAALLGIAVGVLFHINLSLSVILICSLLAFILVALQKNHFIAADTLLGILAHSFLAIGLITISLQPTRVDLMALLLGDLLTVDTNDLMWIGGIAIVVLSALIIFWRPFLSITIHEELAKVEGLPVKLYQLLLMIIIALVIAIAMKMVGVLLITALLIIPAASSRVFSKSPAQMAIIAGLLSCLSVILGLLTGFFYDLPLGPSIVASNALLFLVSQLFVKKTY